MQRLKSSTGHTRCGGAAKLDAALREALLNLGNVSAVPRFHGTQDMDSREVGTGEGAVVHDFRDVAPNGGEQSGEMREAAGPIANEGIETVDASIGGEP